MLNSFISARMSAAIICAAGKAAWISAGRLRSVFGLPVLGLSAASACRYLACLMPQPAGMQPVRCLSLPVFDNSLRFL